MRSDVGGLEEMLTFEHRAHDGENVPVVITQDRCELPDDGLVGKVPFPDRIETEEPQVSRECPEVNVRDESRHPERRRSQPRDRRPRLRPATPSSG